MCDSSPHEGLCAWKTYAALTLQPPKVLFTVHTVAVATKLKPFKMGVHTSLQVIFVLCGKSNQERLSKIVLEEGARLFLAQIDHPQVWDMVRTKPILSEQLVSD